MTYIISLLPHFKYFYPLHTHLTANPTIMTRIQDSIFIPAPVEEVFRYTSDWREWSDWFEGVSTFYPISEMHQGEGARYSYYVNLFGLAIRVETEVRDYVENEGWRGVATRGIPHEAHWDFESVRDGTRFTYTLEYSLRLPLIGAFLDRVLVEPRWRRAIRHSLENLKAHFAQVREEAGVA